MHRLVFEIFGGNLVFLCKRLVGLVQGCNFALRLLACRGGGIRRCPCLVHLFVFSVIYLLTLALRRVRLPDVSQSVALRLFPCLLLLLVGLPLHLFSVSRLLLLILTLRFQRALQCQQFFLVLLNLGGSRPRPRRSDDGRGEVAVLLRRLPCENSLGGEVAEHRRVELLQPFRRLDALLL